MTKVLFWNINNFGSNGFYPGANARPRSYGDDGEYGQPAATQDAADRLAILLGVLGAIQPDIVSIVEVRPGPAAAAGELVADQAAFRLLRSIRNSGMPGAAQYCLVPPLVSGIGRAAEAVAVYYRKDRLHFLGPYIWSAGLAWPGPIPMAGIAPTPYPAPWGGPGAKRALPARRIPAGLPNAGEWENRLAGKGTFHPAGGGAQLQFPGANSRSPWLTTFADMVGNRLIRLLSYHAPSNRVFARNGTIRLAQIPEITAAPLGANEVRCIAGDFNVSALEPVDRAAAFGPLQAIGYAMAFDPAAAPAGYPAQGYYATTLKAYQTATPWISSKTGATVYGYPSFGYMGDAAIDNVLTKYGGAAGGAAEMTVCNPVVGSPYALDPAPPPAVNHGAYVSPSRLANPNVFQYNPALGQMGIQGWAANADNARLNFTEWPNYTRIRSTSDHLPIALNI